MDTLTSKEQPHDKRYYIPVSYKKTCQCCGKEFIAHNSKKIYCSRKCKDVGYKRSKGQDSRLEPYKLKCLICGKEFETFNPSKKTCSNDCSVKLKKTRGKKRERNRKRYKYSKEEYKIIVKQRAEQTAKRKEIEKRWNNAVHTVQRECKYCGSLFYCLDTSKKQTCSTECSRKYSNLRKDKRIPDKQIVDKDITLKKLFRRDKGICWICGGKCDYENKSISKNGYIYPGKLYPEIEHVIPVSRGGLHSWENVRLAHKKCNEEKRDQIYPYLPLEKEFAYKEKRKGTQAKRTAQYTLDGKLIKIWPSTAQIERDLGLNSKRIQNVCRGYKSNTGNAYGYHWEYIV